MNQPLHEEWDQSPERLRRTFRFDSFPDAWAFMTKVALAAERQDHHPDWSNSYDRVTIELTSHDKGGAVTERDVRLAATIDRIHDSPT